MDIDLTQIEALFDKTWASVAGLPWDAVASLPWLWIGLGVFLAWVAFWNIQGYLLSHRSGHFAPRLSAAPQLVRYLVSIIASWWFIGQIRVHHMERLKDIRNLVLAPNHQFEADVLLVGMGLRRHAVRFLMAINQTVGWIRAPFFAWLGAISVGYSKENRASAAAQSAVNALVAETRRNRRWHRRFFAWLFGLVRRVALIVFPQGTLIKDDNWDRKQFFKGIMRISREASMATGEDYWVVPIVAVYCTDPTKGTWFQRVLYRLGIRRKFFGREFFGADILVGMPCKRSALPVEDDQAMDAYYERMVETRLECRRLCRASDRMC